MAAKEKILDEIAFISDRISTQVRTVGLSVIAVVWLFLAGGKDKPILPSDPNVSLLILAGEACLLALFADYLQYLAGYLNTKCVFRDGEKAGSLTYTYDYRSNLYRLREFFFWCKQVLVVVGFVALTLSFIGAFL